MVVSQPEKCHFFFDIRVLTVAQVRFLGVARASFYLHSILLAFPGFLMH